MRLDPGEASSQLSLHESHRVFQDAPTTPLGEAWLTMPMTGPPSRERSTPHTNGVGQGALRDSRTPALSHRMKHDKSILALAVSSQYIFAGTQGGEILVG
jgi:di- and tripeptidase